MIGNLAAVSSSLGFAAYTVCVRARPDEDWSLVLPSYAAMVIVICTPTVLLLGRPLVPPPSDVAWAVLHGAVLIVAGLSLYHLGAHVVSAVAMTLMAQSEMVFVPIWVFVVFGEIPRGWTMVGGVMILAAVIATAVLDRPVAVPVTERDAEPAPPQSAM
jgi:drug/metabolite transporter (DMT)-like permease